MQNNNPLTEIIVALIALAFIVAATVLVALGDITFVDALPVYGLAAGVYGGHLALKAPSPAQQANMQQLVSDLTLAMSTLFQHTHPAQPAQPTPAPVVATSPAQASEIPPKAWIAQPAQVPMPAWTAEPAPQAVPQQPFPASSTFPVPVVPK